MKPANTMPGNGEWEQIALEQDLLQSLGEEIDGNRLTLPTLPETAMRVRELTASPDCSINQLARLISADTALAARLLKVVNSSLYRRGKKIDNIQAAITRLGIQLVRPLIIQVSLLQTMYNRNPLINRQLLALSQHSIEIGAHSQALALCYTTLNPEEAMLAGLVHDIGKLPLLERLYSLKNLDNKVRDRLIHLLYNKVGVKILESWKFAPEIIAAAAEHGDLRRRPDSPADYADLVLLAHLLLHMQKNEPLPWLAQLPVFKKLNITPLQVLNDEIRKQHTESAQESLRF